MGSPVIVDGDLLSIPSIFITRTVGILASPTIQASNFSKINGKKVCVKGDEKSIQLNATYSAAPFVNGLGTVKIELDDSTLAKTARAEGNALILESSSFEAVFYVSTPAIDMATGISDPAAANPERIQGKFISSQKFVTAE